MSLLGNCKSCEAPLVVSHSYRQDGEGRLLGADGRPVPLGPGGTPQGPLARHCRVACSECRLPVPDHPYQRQLDEGQAQADAEARKPRPAPAPLPYEPVAAEPYRLLTDRLAALERANAELSARVAALESGAKRRAS